MAAGARERARRGRRGRGHGRRRAGRRDAPRSRSGSSSCTRPAPTARRRCASSFPASATRSAARAAVAALHLVRRLLDAEAGTKTYDFAAVASKAMTSSGSSSRSALPDERRSTRSSAGATTELDAPAERSSRARAPPRHARVPRRRPAGELPEIVDALRDAAAAASRPFALEPLALPRDEQRRDGRPRATRRARRAGSPATSTSGSSSSASTAREARRGFRTSRCSASASGRASSAAARARRLRSVRRRCFPFTSAPGRGAVRGARIRHR